MSDNRQWDSIQLETLNLPYNTALREVDLTPRQVSGSLNTYVTYGGKIMKRPGTLAISNSNISSARIDRLWLYETLDTPVVVYMMASVFNGTNWALYYNRLDGASPGWTSAGSLRQLNASTRPHEATVSRGIFYVKGFPTATSGETLGTVIFNGTGGTPFTTFWGVVGPTVPARISGGVPRLNAAISASATSFNLIAQNTYNLALSSQDFTQTSNWTSTGLAVTSANNIAIDGTATAQVLTSSVADGFIIQTIPVITGVNYTFSVWLKNSVNQNCGLFIVDNNGHGTLASVTEAVTSTWTRFSINTTAASPSFHIQIGGGATLASGNTIQAWGVQVEIANNPTVTGFTPDVTQAAWSKTNLTTTSTNNPDPNGINDAVLFTQTSTNSFIDQVFPSTAGTQLTFSVWLKSGSAVTVPVQLINGNLGSGITLLNAAVTTAWQQFTVTGFPNSSQSTAAIGSGSWGTGTSAIQVWAPQVTFNSPSPYQRTLGSYNLPSAPFNVQIDYELITVTGFSNTTGNVSSCLRGAQGTVPAVHNANVPVVYKDWTASTHPVTVNNFWAYSYAYQTRSGHISNRSPFETNPDNNPSLTGPVINLVPKLQLYGHPDTVNVPNLVVFRSTDGGGTYTQIATITNTGFNPISWSDQYVQSSTSAGSLVVTSFGSGGTAVASSISSPYTIGGSVAGVGGTNFGNAVGFATNANTSPTNPTWTASVSTVLTATIASFKTQAGSVGASQVATTATASGLNSATTAGITTTGATLLVVTLSASAAINTVTVSDSNGNTWHALQNSLGNLGENTGIWYAYDKAGAALVTGAAHTATAALTSGDIGMTFSAFSGTLPNHVDPFDAIAGQSFTTTPSGTTLQTGAIYASIGAVDPTADSALNFQLISPTLTSNSPPPSVISKNTTLSTLAVAMNTTVNTFNIATTYNGVTIAPPTAPFTVTIDNEQMTVTGISSFGIATVTRSVNGSIPQAHALNANMIITPVVGFDTPIPSTPTASYASRLWVGIGNILFYAAQEEINVGIPEEAWPSGQFGNFYRLQFPIVNLIDTTNALYVITTEAIYQLTGSNLETFFIQPILHNIGGAIGHPLAVTKYRESIIWLTSDLRIGILQGGSFRVISEPLGVDYLNLINNSTTTISLRYWAALDKEWVVLSTLNTAAPANNRTWIYDIEKSQKTQQDFWSSPWTIQASCVASGRIREVEQFKRLLFAMYDGTNTTCARITDNVNEYTGYDVLPAVAQNSIDFKLRTNLWMVPPGDHVNLMRRPGLIPIVYGLILEETTFSTPSTDPQIFYYTNDLWTTPKAAAAAEYSVHDDQPLGYRTRIFPIQEKARRFAFEIDKLQTTELFELQDFSIIYNSDAGSGI